MTEAVETEPDVPVYSSVMVNDWTYLVGILREERFLGGLRFIRPSADVDEVWFRGVVAVAVSQLNDQTDPRLAHLPRQPFLLVHDGGVHKLALGYPLREPAELVQVATLLRYEDDDRYSYARRANDVVGLLNTGRS
jgi:hypothetical protein